LKTIIPAKTIMIKQNKILVTGGSGRLGSELHKRLPNALYPSSKVFNVTHYGQMRSYILKYKPQLIVHAAAVVSPPSVERHPEPALETNIIGTAYLAKLCLEYGIKLVYISTDYVFKGDKGNYKEEDPLLPANRYAWSKLGGEAAVSMLPDFLIFRTSLGPKVFPYPQAFTDHFTSRESVDIIAKKIVKTIHAGVNGLMHIGHKKRSVYQYAKALGGKQHINKISRKDVDFPVPKDTSLNTNKYERLVEKKK